MSFSLGRFLLQFQISSKASSNFSPSLIPNVATARNFAAMAAAATPVPIAHKAGEQLLVVIGGGAAGFYGAIRAKTVAPNLNVVIIEKGKPLSKVKISGGGRCNVTNGHFADPMVFAEFNYPRGHRELKGSFFNTHGHMDTMSWFSDHGVPLKIEDDGRVFPVSNCSSSIIDCLLTEAKRRGVESGFELGGTIKEDKTEIMEVSLHTGKTVTNASVDDDGKFYLKIEKRSVDFSESVEADYILIASGSSRQGYGLVTQLGHSILDPVPSLFTFKIKDSMLTELSGVSFSKVEAKLKLENVKRNVPHLTQVGPMVVTHWGLSGPVILRLSAWGARDLFASVYKGVLIVDFIPDLHIEEAKSILSLHKNNFAVIFDKHLLIKVLQKQKVVNSSPSEFGLAKRFWKYILDRQSINGDTLWASISNNSISSTAHTLKNCTFNVEGKGQFKDEFVTAGGVPLSEISLNTMESKICSLLFFAGEVLNVDGVTGGFNFQNAWSGGYIAGSSIGKLAAENAQQERVL